MGFELKPTSVVLDGVDFAASVETTQDKYYFDARIDVKGILNYGTVAKDKEVKIDLAANGISAPIIIDSIVALAQNSTADEIIFFLYRKIGGREIRVGVQRFSNGEMPVDFPDGIITPDMVLGVMPTSTDATIVVYVKPVKILFEAVPNPERVVSNDGSSSSSSGSRS